MANPAYRASEPEFTHPAAEAAWDEYAWDYFADHMLALGDPDYPWLREEVEEQGFVHSTPTGITNNFEILYEMLEDGVLHGRFAIFRDAGQNWVGFENEASAVAFRLKK